MVASALSPDHYTSGQYPGPGPFDLAEKKIPQRWKVTKQVCIRRKKFSKS